jgi:hypothetical protein
MEECERLIGDGDVGSKSGAIDANAFNNFEGSTNCKAVFLALQAGKRAMSMEQYETLQLG